MLVLATCESSGIHLDGQSLLLLLLLLEEAVRRQEVLEKDSSRQIAGKITTTIRDHYQQSYTGGKMAGKSNRSDKWRDQSRYEAAAAAQCTAAGLLFLTS